MEKLIIIDPLSVNNKAYFKKDGTTTTNKNEAMVVHSIEEGQEKARSMTLYQPIYETLTIDEKESLMLWSTDEKTNRIITRIFFVFVIIGLSWCFYILTHV